MSIRRSDRPGTVASLTQVLAPIAAARGLPNEHYTGNSVFQEERQALLFDGWAGIGFASDVPRAGDARPVTLLGMPLLLLRDAAGTVSVFQNTCRHRGMILISEPTAIRRVIRCPYHGWCYGLDGSLRATPHVGGPDCDTHPAIEPDDLGLVRIRTAVYLGVVFVNVSGTAPDFEVHAGALRARWPEFDAPLFDGGPESRFTLDVRSNWKLAVENYCESYHLPSIHPGLNSYSRLQDHYDIGPPDDAADTPPAPFSGQGTRVYRQLRDETGLRLPDFANTAERWDTAAEYVALYPNVLLGVHRDHVFALILEPLGVDHTRERIALFYTEAGASDDRYRSLREQNATLWQGVFEEDVQVVEGMQAGRHGVHFDGGRFSPAMDVPTHGFHRWVAGRIDTYRRSDPDASGHDPA